MVRWYMLFGVVSLIGWICHLGSMVGGPSIFVSFPQFFFLLVSCLAACHEFMIPTAFQEFEQLLYFLALLADDCLPES